MSTCNVFQGTENILTNDEECQRLSKISRSKSIEFFKTLNPEQQKNYLTMESQFIDCILRGITAIDNKIKDIMA